MKEKSTLHQASRTFLYMEVSREWYLVEISREIEKFLERVSIVHIGDSDRAIWLLDGSSKFTCAYTWQHLRVEKGEVQWWKLVWFIAVVPKHSFIGWLTIRNRLITKNRLLH